VRAFDPCLWHDPEGKLWLFWGQETTQAKGRDFGTFVTFAITTTDSGKADEKWSAPRQIAKGVMMNKPTVTKDGRWLLPVSSWYTDGSSRAVVSTDHGATFAELGAANIPDKKSRSADEHMIVERKDGSLWMLVRGKFVAGDGGITGLGESVSTDGGKTWSDVKASAIPHLTTRFFIRRLESGRLLLVRQNPPAGAKGRSHLTAFLSDDDGRTWKGGLLLDERDGACYPDCVQASDGTISVIYDFQRARDKEILMAVFNETEVLEGKLTSPKSQLRVLVNKATGVKTAKPVTAQPAKPATAEHWPLDAVDAAVKVYGTATKAAGAKGQCLVLDGSQVIELKGSGRLNGGAEGFTFSVWVNSYAPQNGQQMIAAKNRYSLGERQWSLAIESNGHVRAYLQQEKWKPINTSEALQPGRWYLVTLTVTNAKATLFLNGQPAGEVALTQALPATEAPITLGGVSDRGRLLQQFVGAVDEARWEPRVWSAAEIAASYQPVTAMHAIPQPLVSKTPVWLDEQPVPKAAELTDLEGVTFHVIKANEPEKDGYIWLHGVGLGWHKGNLFASFGHNRGEENTPGEEARGRVSGDGGKTWSDAFAIGVGDAPNHAVSHGVFLSRGDELWAFHGSFYGNKLTDIASSKVHTRAYRLNETSNIWESKGTVIEGGFWPMQEPLKMRDGNWIMSGISVGNGHCAAVAISHGEDLAKWDLVVIPKPANQTMWGESTIVVDGRRVQNFSRFGARPLALTAVSEDCGRHWTESLPSNLPMATSKPYSGTLSTGQRYLICTTTADTGGRRSPLTIAVGRPGENGFRKVFRIRNSQCSQSPGDSHPNASLSYPYAIEHDGKLYVGYSNSGGRHGNHNSAELAVVPINALQVE
ncbi:MAG: exo-alpha-sialidase, partial [Chthoniobacteraceae bacterium]